MRTAGIGLSLIFAAGVACPSIGWAGPECSASAALQSPIAATHQWSAAVTVEVPSCRRSQGQFVLITQSEAMNGRIEIVERPQRWHFDDHGKGQFIYVIDQGRDAVVTDAWVRKDVDCACLD